LTAGLFSSVVKFVQEKFLKRLLAGNTAQIKRFNRFDLRKLFIYYIRLLNNKVLTE